MKNEMEINTNQDAMDLVCPEDVVHDDDFVTLRAETLLHNKNQLEAFMKELRTYIVGNEEEYLTESESGESVQRNIDENANQSDVGGKRKRPHVYEDCADDEDDDNDDWNSVARAGYESDSEDEWSDVTSRPRKRRKNNHTERKHMTTNHGNKRKCDTDDISEYSNGFKRPKTMMRFNSETKLDINLDQQTHGPIKIHDCLGTCSASSIYSDAFESSSDLSSNSETSSESSAESSSTSGSDSNSSSDSDQVSNSESSSESSSSDSEISPSDDDVSEYDHNNKMYSCASKCVCNSGPSLPPAPIERYGRRRMIPLHKKLLQRRLLSYGNTSLYDCCGDRCYARWMRKRISFSRLVNDYSPSDLQVYHFSWGDWKPEVDVMDSDSDEDDCFL